jgi:hypothetical protein
MTYIEILSHTCQKAFARSVAANAAHYDLFDRDVAARGMMRFARAIASARSADEATQAPSVG